MQRWITAMLGSMLVAFGAAAPATAQLVGGGLAAQPTVQLGGDILKNGGFETLSGSVPANWGTGSGWAADQITKHSGTFSYRRDSGAPSVSQPIALKKGTYKLSAWIKAQNLGSGSTSGVRLMFNKRPTVNEWTTTEVLSGTFDWRLYELKNLVVTQDMTVNITLENYAGAAGTAWFDDVTLQEQLPQGVDVFMLYPNFRGMLFDDGPSTMKFAVTVTPPGGDFSRYKVTGRLKDATSGQVLTTQNYAASASFTAEMSGALMQPGRAYLVTFDLVDLSSNATASTYPAYRVSRVAAGQRASLKIAFDEKNRVLMNGVPRFLLGVYDSGSGYSTDPAFWDNLLWSPTGTRRMDNLKINMYLNYWYGQASIDAMNALMTSLKSHGVMYLQTGNCFDKYPADGGFNINASDSYVQSFASHPAAAGYYTIDECLSSLIPGAFTQYDRLRRLDPASVTFMANFGNPELPLWRDTVDLLSTDPYPMYGAEPAAGYNHGQVADWTRNTRLALKDSRPFNTVLQFFKFTSQGRWPTRQEMRNHAYMAIVEGARGLWWWSLGDNALLAVCSGWCAEKTDHMNDLKAVVNEIAGLEPALIADDVPTALTGNSNPGAIKTKVKIVNGTGYLFAYNATNTTAAATFTWNTATGVVQVNAENRTVAASGNSFTDSFGPFQAHVYVLGNGGKGGTTGGTSGGTGGGTTISPTVTFTNPAASTTTVSGTVTVTMAASGGSGSGYTYKLAVDGASVYNGTNGTFSWNTTTASNGGHTLTATVTDSAGQSGSATRTLTVSNTTTTPPPGGTLQVSITQPTRGATVSGTNWAVIWVSGTTGTSNAYTLSVGTQTVGTTTTSSTGPVSIPWNTASVPNGTQTLTASVRDAGGNTGTTGISVNVSNAGTTSTPPPAPLTIAISSPTATTVSGTVSFSATASGGSGYSYKLAIDGTQVATTSSYSWNTTTATNATHTLTATVTDAAGRTASASKTVTVSNTTTTTGSLAVAITQPTSGATVSGTAWVVMWVNGASGTSNLFTLSVDGVAVATSTVSNTGPVTLPWNTATAVNGNHTITATVRDATGNTGSTSLTVRVAN